MFYLLEKVKVMGKCFWFMRKNEFLYVLEIFVKLENKGIIGKCFCVVGVSGYCYYIIGLLFYMVYCKMFGFVLLLDDLICISLL